ncbi:MAG TPA: hypothetical protein VK946_00515 [Methylotenera sp.]|nr:hypothetical protein [Methylotenera sp.]
MNKFLTTLFAGAVALSLGTSAFAADAAKPAEPAAKTSKEKPAVPAAKKVDAHKKDAAK